MLLEPRKGDESQSRVSTGTGGRTISEAGNGSAAPLLDRLPRLPRPPVREERKKCSVSYDVREECSVSYDAILVYSLEVKTNRQNRQNPFLIF